MGVDSSQPLYSIGATSKLAGVSVGTLRTWHERYGVVIPGRSPGGHRLYSRDQVEQLRFIADQVSLGLSSADAHRVLADHLAAGNFSHQEPTKGRMLILLAERDPYAAELAEYFLREEGYEVTLASSVDDAMTRTAEYSVDVAIVDLLISGSRGLELCARLHDRKKPVVAISTFDSADAALEAGASAFLQKPLGALQLVSAVRDLSGHGVWADQNPSGLVPES